MVVAAMTTGNPLRLLIIGASELLHAGLRAMVEPACVCACTVDDQDAHVDLVVVLVQDRGSVERVLTVAERASAPILALLPDGDVPGAESALRAGAVDVVHYSVAREALMDAVFRAAGATPHTDDGLRRDPPQVRRPAALSEREAEVLGLVACGLSNQEICDQLYLSINTVKTYVRTAYHKIGVKSRSQAVAWCVQHGLVAMPRVAESKPPG